MSTSTARRLTPCFPNGASTRRASSLHHRGQPLAAQRRLVPGLHRQDPDTGKPIIKAHVDPLVMWIWIGVVVTGFGTVLALIPNMKPGKTNVTQKEREQAEPQPDGARWKWVEIEVAQTTPAPNASAMRYRRARHCLHGGRRRCPLQQVGPPANVYVRLQPGLAGM